MQASQYYPPPTMTTATSGGCSSYRQYLRHHRYIRNNSDDTSIAKSLLRSSTVDNWQGGGNNNDVDVRMSTISCASSEEGDEDAVEDFTDDVRIADENSTSNCDQQSSMSLKNLPTTNCLERVSSRTGDGVMNDRSVARSWNDKPLQRPSGTTASVANNNYIRLPMPDAVPEVGLDACQRNAASRSNGKGRLKRRWSADRKHLLQLEHSDQRQVKNTSAVGYSDLNSSIAATPVATRPTSDGDQRYGTIRCSACRQMALPSDLEQADTGQGNGCESNGRDAIPVTGLTTLKRVPSWSAPDLVTCRCNGNVSVSPSGDQQWLMTLEGCCDSPSST